MPITTTLKTLSIATLSEIEGNLALVDDGIGEADGGMCFDGSYLWRFQSRRLVCEALVCRDDASDVRILPRLRLLGLGSGVIILGLEIDGEARRHDCCA